MKHKFIILVVVLALFFTFIVVSAQDQTMQIKMKIGDYNATVDDKPIKLNQPPTIVNGRTMIPARDIFSIFFPDDKLPEEARKLKDIKFDSGDVTITAPDIGLLYSNIKSLQNENTTLKKMNAELQAELEKCKEANEPGPSTQVPPIVYQREKPPLVFTLKSCDRERDALRINIKIYNKDQWPLRFPATRTRMTIGDETFEPTDYDSIFMNPIPAGAERSGWVRFPPSFNGVATFSFAMWPQDIHLYFTFSLPVNLDKAIPTVRYPLEIPQ